MNSCTVVISTGGFNGGFEGIFDEVNGVGYCGGDGASAIFVLFL